MACRVTNVCVFIILFAFLWEGSSAQSSCMSSLMGLSPCLDYVTGNTSTLSSSCCSRLSGVVQSQPQCLCLLLNGTASSYGYNINQTLALQLPGACRVQTPPTSRCNEANEPSSTNTPATTPTPSPSRSSNGFPNAGSKTVPSPDAAGSSTKVACNAAVLITALVASYVAGF